MARKTLLNEQEIRQFLKLANITTVGEEQIQEMGGKYYNRDAPETPQSEDDPDDDAGVTNEEEEMEMDMKMDADDGAMDAMDDQLPALTSFVLPGGHQSVSFSHIARCVCRRAERISIALNDQEPISPLVIQYLNRLSDYLFVLGRIMAQELQAEEVKWEPRKK